MSPNAVQIATTDAGIPACLPAWRACLAGVWLTPPTPGPPFLSSNGPLPTEWARSVGRRSNFGEIWLWLLFLPGGSAFPIWQKAVQSPFFIFLLFFVRRITMKGVVWLMDCSDVDAVAELCGHNKDLFVCATECLPIQVQKNNFSCRVTSVRIHGPVYGFR